MFQSACVRVLGVAFGLGLVVGCGSEATFHGIGETFSGKKNDADDHNSTSGDSDAMPVTAGPADGGNLFWLWSCGTDSLQHKLGSDDVKISGAGTHRVTKPDSGFPLQIAGQVCQPRSGTRDITFVIDVSSSMGGVKKSGWKVAGHDSLDDNTCNRRKAVERLLDGVVNDGRVRIAIVTFDGSVAATSGGFRSVDDIRKDYLQNDILCYSGSTTSYGAGLSETLKHMPQARPEASRELYFISDGEPGDNGQGKEEARKLRDDYRVTIGTVMIGRGENDEVLKSDIASRDGTGQPIHVKIADASQLADTLAFISERNIVGGKIRLRAIGTDPWQERDVIQVARNNEFVWQVENFAPDQFPNGLEFVLDYWDQHGQKYGGSGTIIWD